MNPVLGRRNWGAGLLKGSWQVFYSACHNKNVTCLLNRDGKPNEDVILLESDISDPCVNYFWITDWIACVYSKRKRRISVCIGLEFISYSNILIQNASSNLKCSHGLKILIGWQLSKSLSGAIVQSFRCSITFLLCNDGEASIFWETVFYQSVRIFVYTSLLWCMGASKIKMQIALMVHLHVWRTPCRFQKWSCVPCALKWFQSFDHVWLIVQFCPRPFESVSSLSFVQRYLIMAWRWFMPMMVWVQIQP